MTLSKGVVNETCTMRYKKGYRESVVLVKKGMKLSTESRQMCRALCRCLDGLLLHLKEGIDLFFQARELL